MKSAEKLIISVYSLKKLNHFGETDCLQSSEQLKETLLHSEGPLNHQNTPTTQVQKIMKSGRFLGGGRRSDFMSTVPYLDPKSVPFYS